MSDIRDIDIKDVKYFIDYHRLNNKDDPYTVLWNFLLSNKNKNLMTPISIANWIIAYNNSKIDMLNDNLPEELLIKIILSGDYNDIPKLCRSSNKINKLCNTRVIPFLKDKLFASTGLKVDNYNFQQLIYLGQQLKYRQYKKIAASPTHTLIVSKGEVYSCGEGALGFTNIDESNELIKIDGLKNIIEVAVGSNHSMALDNMGRVYVFGNNDSGQLGLGDSIDRKTPTMIPNLPKIVNISCSLSSSSLLSEDGNVYTFGQHIGLRNLPDDLLPVLNTKLKNIIQISMGSLYLLALDNNGKVYGYGESSGDNIKLERGRYLYVDPVDADYPKNITYISSGSSESYAIDKNGKLYAHGSYFDHKILKNNKLSTLTNYFIDRVYPSGYSMTGESNNTILLVLDNNMKLHELSFNFFDKISVLDIKEINIPNIVSVARSIYEYFLVDINGNLYVKGDNTFGQLGMENNFMIKDYILNPHIKIDT